MAVKTPNPTDVQRQLDKVYEAAESLRQYSLTQLAEEEKSDVDLLQEVRAELAREVGENDPRVRALDRRIAGSVRFVEIAREVGGETALKPSPNRQEPAVLKESEKPKEAEPAGGPQTEKPAKPAKKQAAKKE